MCQWDHKVVEVGKNLWWSSGSISLFRAGLAAVSFSGLCPVVYFNISKDGCCILNNLLEKLTTLKVKKIYFPYVSIKISIIQLMPILWPDGSSWALLIEQYLSVPLGLLLLCFGQPGLLEGARGRRVGMRWSEGSQAILRFLFFLPFFTLS